MNDLLEATAFARRLADPASAHPAADFPSGQGEVDEAGLYAWRVDPAGLALLSAVFSTSLPPLIYAGQAGASSSVAATPRAATLRSRIMGNHLSGSISSSTFRRTLTAALRAPLDLELGQPGRLTRESNKAVSEWMRAHLSVTTASCPDRAALAAIETAALQALDPPLNLMGMASTPVRRRLKELRRQLGSTRPSDA